MAKNVPLQMYRGDSLVFDVVAVRPDPENPNELEIVDLTGGKAWFTAKRQINVPDENATLRLSTALGGVTIEDPINGRVRVAIVPSAFANLPDDPVVLSYDVQVADSAGIVTTVWAGALTVLPDVTRATA